MMFSAETHSIPILFLSSCSGSAAHARKVTTSRATSVSVAGLHFKSDYLAPKVSFSPEQMPERALTFVENGIDDQGYLLTGVTWRSLVIDVNNL